jgi:hypothetical protein
VADGDGVSVDLHASGVANALFQSAEADPGRDIAGLGSTAEVARNAAILHAVGDVVQIVVVAVAGVEGELALQRSLGGAAILVGDVMAAVRAVVGAEGKATDVVAEVAVVLAGARAGSAGRLGLEWNGGSAGRHLDVRARAEYLDVVVMCE